MINMFSNYVLYLIDISVLYLIVLYQYYIQYIYSTVSDSQSQRKSVLNIYWKDWCWSSNTLATWCEELTPWKRPWHWERLKAGGEGDDRGWDGLKASLIQRTWVWVSSGSWWWTGKPGMLQFMGHKVWDMTD